MIIFYRKSTGIIEGIIEGRIHSERHNNIFIGNSSENDKLLINWKPIKDYKNGKGEIIGQDFEPDHKQKELIIYLDNNPSEIYKYKIDITTKQLISNE